MALDPKKFVKAAQDVASGKGGKQAAAELIKSKLAALITIKALPFVAIVLVIALFIGFIVYAVTATAESVKAIGGDDCVSMEMVSAQREEIAKIKDRDARAEADERLNKMVENSTICEYGATGGFLPEGVNGGVYYDQMALDKIIKKIKKYLTSGGTVPSLEETIAAVNATIDGNNLSGLSQAEKDKKKKAVSKKINELYTAGSTAQAKWSSIVNYLEDERGPTLWKGEIGNKIVNAVRSKVGMPYIFGNRNNWTGNCYSNIARDNSSGTNIVKGCGFDCSSLAGYGAAVGNGKSTAVRKEGSNSWIAAGWPYYGSVGTLVDEARAGRWTFISAGELAPGDFVTMSSNTESNFHVAIYVGKNDAGKNLYVEAPRPGKFVIQRESWWAGYKLTYIRPYDTIRFEG